MNEPYLLRKTTFYKGDKKMIEKRKLSYYINHGLYDTVSFQGIDGAIIYDDRIEPDSIGAKRVLYEILGDPENKYPIAIMEDGVKEDERLYASLVLDEGIPVELFVEDEKGCRGIDLDQYPIILQNININTYSDLKF